MENTTDTNNENVNGSVEASQSEKKVSKKTKKDGKKKNPFLSFIKGLLIFILVLVILLLGIFLYSAFDRKASENAIPQDFSLILSTDNIYKAVNPLLDLKAVDVFLSSEEELSSVLPTLVSIRKSPLRKNKVIQFLLSRKVRAAFYTASNTQDTKFLCVTDLSFLSFATRLMPVVPEKLLKVDGLTIQKEGKKCIYVFEIPKDDKKNGSSSQTKDSTSQSATSDIKEASSSQKIYFMPYKNLFMVSMDEKVMNDSFALLNGGNTALKEGEVRKENWKKKILSKDGKPFKIVVDAKKLVSDFSSSIENPEIGKVLDEILSDSYSIISLDLSDEDVKVFASLPFEVPSSEKYRTLSTLLEAKSSVPSVLSQLPGSVQYYTIFNLGELELIKNAAFTLLSSEKNYESLWKKTSDICSSVLNNSLEELLFSWSGKELIAFGLEGEVNPVFALKIADEKKRAEVFDRLSTSIVLKDDTSLIMNGVRLPKLVFPDFLKNLLKTFGVNLPEAYYTVSNGFIYFSKSPEPLFTVYNSFVSESRLSKNQNWRAVTGKDNHTSLSLFYDLERSIPFFISESGSISKVLSLYTIGRLDFKVEDKAFEVSLNASGKKSGGIKEIPGYPVKLNGSAGDKLLTFNDKKSGLVFWVEDELFVKGLDTKTGKTYSFESGSPLWISASKNPKDLRKIWAVTRSGEIFLLDENLNVLPDYPLYTDYRPSAEPASWEGGLVLPLINGSLCFADFDRNLEETEINVSGSIKSSPSILDKTICVYEKSFAGKIHVIDGKEKKEKYESLSIPGVAYGSPAIFKNGKSECVSMITQSGNLFLWEDGVLNPSFPIKLDGLFYSNVVYSGSYIFALSAESALYRISLDGSYTSVVIPNVTSKEGFISVAENDKKKEKPVYLSVDGNLIYGFASSLEILPGFPVAGWKNPVFMDVNGDNEEDCLCLSVNNSLNAWNLK